MEDNKTHQLLGQLIEAQNNTTRTVSEMSQVVQAHTTRLGDFEHGLSRANQDLMRLRESMITPETLRRLGLDMDDHEAHRKDSEFLRSSRLSAEERKPIMRSTITALITAATLGAAVWAWGAVMDKAKHDLNSQTVSEEKK